MSGFELSSLRNTSVWGIYRIRDRVEMDPLYQREGDIWNPDKKQLLIDTIINQFDVPKIYLHKFSKPIERDGKTYDYAVIDGKQRLTAIWDFIDAQFALANDFSYLKAEDDGTVVAVGGLTYADLGRKHPDIKTDFDAYTLDVVCVETDDIELIEDLFSRLNEAVPLSAPEKRNARPGPLPSAVRAIAKHDFFVDNLPFSNKRYRHFDLAAKKLLITHKDDVSDTKKMYLDKFFDDSESFKTELVERYTSHINLALENMNAIFVHGDNLLRQIGMAVLYFYIFRRAISLNKISLLHREGFVTFDEKRRSNHKIAEADIARADYRLLEFDRLTQSPNDAYAMRLRLAVIDEIAFNGQLGFPPIVPTKST